MGEMIRLLVVDDHALFRLGIVRLLQEQPDFKIIGEAADGREAIHLAQQKKPQVVLMDVHMPGGGVDAVHTIKQTTSAHVLMLSISDKDQDLMGALQAGADGYLLKSAEPDELCRAIRQVASGHSVLAPELTARVIQTAAKGGLSSKILSKREQEVLNHLAVGETTSQIAAALFISENTVKTHVRRILKKLNVANRTEAVARAAALGLITSGQT